MNLFVSGIGDTAEVGALLNYGSVCVCMHTVVGVPKGIEQPKFILNKCHLLRLMGNNGQIPSMKGIYIVTL